jgi:hypothetical protein
MLYNYYRLEIEMPVRRVGWFLFVLFPLLLLSCETSTDPEPPIVIETFVNPYSWNDTYLRLFDFAGNLIAEDDNGNPDQANHKGCSRINIAGGLESGTYYIRVHKVYNPIDGDGNPNYGIRVVDYDPGDSIPTTSTTTDETEPPGPEDDAIDGTGVDDGLPTNPVSISIGDELSRAISPEDTDVDWFVLVIP